MQFGKLNFLATLGRREKLLLSGRNLRKFSCQKQMKLENFDHIYIRHIVFRQYTIGTLQIED